MCIMAHRNDVRINLILRDNGTTTAILKTKHINNSILKGTVHFSIEIRLYMNFPFQCISLLLSLFA